MAASNIGWKSLLFVILTLAFAALAGCPGPTFVVQHYPGPQRPAETVSTLRVNGNEPVRLVFLDDEDVAAPVAEDGRLHIELLPGRHTVVVANANTPSERHPAIAFQAEAGKVYRVAFAPGAAGSEPRIFEVDRGNDRAIRDVTQPAASELPPASSPPAARAPSEDAGAPAADDAGTTTADAGG